MTFSKLPKNTLSSSELRSLGAYKRSTYLRADVWASGPSISLVPKLSSHRQIATIQTGESCSWQSKMLRHQYRL